MEFQIAALGRVIAVNGPNKPHGQRLIDVITIQMCADHQGFVLPDHTVDTPKVFLYKSITLSYCHFEQSFLILGRGELLPTPPVQISAYAASIKSAVRTSTNSFPARSPVWMMT